MDRTYKIAAVPGDGIGKETVPEGLRVLEAAATRFGFTLQTTDYDWSCERYVKHGAMMPADGLDQLREHDAVFLGAVGWPDVPDHVSLWGLLIPIRRGFDQYASVRPCKLMPGARTPLAGRTEQDIDFYVVRENTEGEYSSLGGRLFEGTDREFATQQTVFTRHGTDRILRYAFELARTRPRRKVTSATKSNGITITMPYWDERFAAMATQLPGREDGPVPHRHPLRALRAASRLVRRGGRQQPVRGHPERSRPGGRRQHRHRAERQHQPGAAAPQHVRAGARLGARHRRPERLQPDRAGLVRRHDAGAPRRDGGGPGGGRRDRDAAARGGPRTRDMGGQAGTEEVGKALAEIVAAG